jgi:hypothetical protein
MGEKKIEIKNEISLFSPLSSLLSPLSSLLSPLSSLKLVPPISI